MAVKYTNIFNCYIIYLNGDFWYENMPSGNPAPNSPTSVSKFADAKEKFQREPKFVEKILSVSRTADNFR
jgi:hypothetical protein